MIRGTVLRYIRNVAIAIDDLGSALTAGDGQETISSRLGKAQRGDYGTRAKFMTSPLRWLVDAAAQIVFGQQGHCLASVEDDRGQNACDGTEE